MADRLFKQIGRVRQRGIFLALRYPFTVNLKMRRLFIRRRDGTVGISNENLAAAVFQG